MSARGGGGDFLPFPPPCINHCQQGSSVLSDQREPFQERDSESRCKFGGCKVHAREIFAVQTGEGETYTKKLQFWWDIPGLNQLKHSCGNINSHKFFLVN